MILFLLTLLISPLIGFTICFFFKKRTNTFTLIFLSAGFGIVVYSLVFYWLLILIPGMNSNSYVLSFLVLAIFFGFISIKYWLNRNEYEELFEVSSAKSSATTLSFTFCLFLLGFIYSSEFNSYYTSYLERPIIGSDFTGYVVEGNIYFRDLSLDSKYLRIDEVSGYASFSDHPPIFSLIQTFDKIVSNEIFDGINNEEKLIRLSSPFYALLTIMLIFWLLSKISVLMAILSIVSLLTSWIFIQSATLYHIDHIRVFFISYSFAALYWLFQSNRSYALINHGLLAFVLMLSSSLHSINFVISICTVFVIFCYSYRKVRVLNLIFVYLLFIFFGAGFHYMLDLFNGELRVMSWLNR